MVKSTGTVCRTGRNEKSIEKGFKRNELRQSSSQIGTEYATDNYIGR